MTIAPAVLPPDDFTVVMRLYQPAARSSGRAIVLTAPTEVRSVTRMGEARRVSEMVTATFHVIRIWKQYGRGGDQTARCVSLNPCSPTPDSSGSALGRAASLDREP